MKRLILGTCALFMSTAAAAQNQYCYARIYDTQTFNENIDSHGTGRARQRTGAIQIAIEPIAEGLAVEVDAYLADGMGEAILYCTAISVGDKYSCEQLSTDDPSTGELIFNGGASLTFKTTNMGVAHPILAADGRLNQKIADRNDNDTNVIATTYKLYKTQNSACRFLSDEHQAAFMNAIGSSY